MAHYEIYMWILCLSYLHEKQISRIQSLYLYFINIVPFCLWNICFKYTTGRYSEQPPAHTSRMFLHGTRAPRGTDRSPEYNEYFCYKLDSRVKNLTKEWNKKHQHFITHASRSLLWIQFVAEAFRSEEENFWRGPPWPILPRPESAPGQIWSKHLYACARPWALHPYQVS